MAKSKCDDGLICLGVYIPLDDHEKLKQIVASKKQELGVRVTLSDVIRLAIGEYIKKESA